MKCLKVLVFLVSIMMVAAPAQARQAVGVYEKIVDSFVYLVDNSGSMMMEHMATDDQKIEMAKSIIIRLDSLVPELGYQAALTLFSPDANVVAPTVWQPMDFCEAALTISNAAPIFGRLTRVGESVPAISNVLSALPGMSAVFYISDGNETLGMTPAEAVAALYAANPNTIVHVISLADTAEGLARLQAVAALKEGSVFVDGRMLLDSDQLAERFIESTLYIPTLPSDEVVGLQEVLFDTGRYEILPKYAEMLDEVASVLVTRADLKIFVEGFADITGGTQSNLTLSQNRANAVAQYLVSRGVRPSQFIIEGSGETNHYPTLLLNRRADIMVIWD